MAKKPASKSSEKSSPKSSPRPAAKAPKAAKPAKAPSAAKAAPPAKASAPAKPTPPAKPATLPKAKAAAKSSSLVAGGGAGLGVGASSTSSAAPATPPPVPPSRPKAKAAAAPAPVRDVDDDAELETATPPGPEIEVDENGEAILTDLEIAPAEPPAKVEKVPERIPIPKNLPPRRADGVITLAHSPDADDAFMFYALASGKVETEDRRYEHVLKDIQSLNEAAKKGTYDVTALSFHAYPYVRRNYALLTCGASFGDAYGPVLVAKTPIRPSEVDGMTVAIPGELTTAALVTRMWFGRAHIDAKNVPFDKVTDLVKAGLVRAGVIIHEGQLTYKELGLVKVVDFGQWWSERTEGLPLPLGGNGVRRDLPAPLMAKIALDIKRSIAYALGHREEALAHAMKYGRNLPKEKADKFVGMYVNDLTLDYGERGRQAVKYLLDKAVDEGLLAERVDPEFVG